MTNRQLFLSNIAQTSDNPLMLEINSANGIYLYSNSGRRFIDLISGISVSNIGHGSIEVISAAKNQIDQHMHLMVYGEFVQSPQVQFAELLTSLLPRSLNSVYFVNSGSEATEGALKVAKRYTQRQQIIYCKDAYHGSTHGALSVMGNADLSNPFGPLLPNTKQISFNSDEDLNSISTATACVIVETVQGEAGVRLPEHNYLANLRRACTEAGALLVLDEIQVGMGRSGTMFAFEQYGIEPDILLLAKALGGGMPIGAFIGSQEIMGSLKSNPALGHITTFGGHPVCCASGKAALEVLLKNNIISTVKEKSALFRELLQHNAIREIRSAGLLMAVEFDSFEINKKIIDACIENGLVTDWFLFADNCMRIAPPLIITEEQIEEACSIILKSINSVI